MKRGDEDQGVGAGPNAKKPAGAPGVGPQPGIPRVKDALGYLEKVKTKFMNRPQVYNQFLDIMKDFKSQAINTEGVIERVKTLFKGHRSLILGFNQFLPPGYKVEMPPEKPAPPPAAAQPKTTTEFKHAVEYVAKIKTRFKDKPDIYSEFLDILHEYQAKRTIDEVYGRVERLFAGQPDLLDEFKYFLPDNSPPPSRRSKSRMRKKTARGYKKRSRSKGHGVEMEEYMYEKGIKDNDKAVNYPPGCERELDTFQRIRGSVQINYWNQFVKAMHLFAEQVVTRPEFMQMVRDIFEERYPAVVDDVANAIEFTAWEERRYAVKTRSDYHAFVASEEFKRLPQASDSYKIVPDDIPVLSCAARTALCDSVLNDKCISSPTGSEEQFSFNHTRKNIYEENLNRVEDERFELDLMIENNAAAIRVLEPMMKDISTCSVERAKQLQLPTSVDVLHLKAISRIYGDNGRDVIDALKRAPAVVVPLVLRRLHQKDKEWRNLRLSMRNQWRKICEANYFKSLDHRSFYFKQEDKKRLSTKGLEEEIFRLHCDMFGLDINASDAVEEPPVTRARSSRKGSEDVEKRRVRRNPHEQPVPGALTKPWLSYCMRFDYGDNDIHAQIYEIMQRVVATRLSSKAKEEFFAFWHFLVHHFFSLPIPEDAMPAPSPVPSQDTEEAKDSPDNAAPAAAPTAAPMEVDQAESAISALAAAASSSSRRRKGKVARRGRNAATPSPTPMDTQGSKQEDSEAGSGGTSSESDNSRPSVVASLRKVMEYGHQDIRAQVKPVAIMLDTWDLEEKLHPMRRHTRPSKLFFGSRDYYVFFRLHQFLYRRLHDAKRLSAEWRARKVTSAAAAHAPKRRRKKQKVAVTSPAEAHMEFKRLLGALLDGNLEISKYEDEVRTLLGAKSYSLFTLDKLIKQLVDHVVSLVNSEKNVELLDLYHYEAVRAKDFPRTLERSGQMARMYHANCFNILGDTTCYQIEYFEDTHQLGFGLAPRTDMLHGGLGSDDQQGAWMGYLKGYLDNKVENLSIMDGKNGATKPLLTRNLRRAFQAYGVTQLSELPKALVGVEIINSREHKIDEEKCKDHPVEETEDFLRRHGLLKLTPLELKKLSEPVSEEERQKVIEAAKARRDAQRKVKLGKQKAKTKTKLDALFAERFPNFTPPASVLEAVGVAEATDATKTADMAGPPSLEVDDVEMAT